MLSKDLVKILEQREFISVATCDFKGKPNAAPKFLLKIENGKIYLVDYTIGQTYRNIRINPRASMSALDQSTLKGYQINGSVSIIDKGRKYNSLKKEMLDKEVRLTAKHIIEDVRGQAHHESFEVVITDKFIFFEVRVDEIVEMDIKGELKRTKKDMQIKSGGIIDV